MHTLAQEGEGKRVIKVAISASYRFNQLRHAGTHFFECAAPFGACAALLVDLGFMEYAIHTIRQHFDQHIEQVALHPIE